MKCKEYLRDNPQLPAKRMRKNNPEFDESWQDEEMEEKNGEGNENEKTDSKEKTRQRKIKKFNPGVEENKEEDESLAPIEYDKQLALKEAVMRTSPDIINMIIKIVEQTDKKAIFTSKQTIAIKVENLSRVTFEKIWKLVNGQD